jgi:hypothetical protein
MHDEIQRFNLNGEIADIEVSQTKERLVDFVEGMMRDQGFVPALDLEPQFTLDFDSETEQFTFALSVYGVKIDKDKTWNVGGILSGKEIPRYTPKNKSQQSSPSVESK